MKSNKRFIDKATTKEKAADRKQDLDPRVISLSEVPYELLPAFGPIEQAVILYCKVEAGKATMEELEKRYRKKR